MSSIIEGYNYDIFISYRQKDNKHDGWVTEFVDNLRGELESTFKEEISLYFDINPHDGLLETHDVDASLKDKLKCLIFIPIISRTYCDPKSFAWEHEFKAFVEEASRDQYRLKVKLPNGNVASRVLPIRIHDLETDDIKLCESILGGVLRGIEFIFKESGFNRPLKPDDDEKINLNKTKYRNQITKVALAIKEIIIGLKTVPDLLVTKKSHLEESMDDAKSEHIRKTVISKGMISQRSKKWLIDLLSLVLCIVGTFTIFKIIEGSKQASDISKLEKSIAVLPFVNDSPVDSNKYFINGIMDEILNNLQKIKNFRVLSRTSTEQYSGSNKPAIPKIAKELDVNYIVEGSGQKYGNKFVLRVQLIAANNEKHLWGESFEQEIRETSDIINLQSQIAQAIAEALKATITPEEKQLIEKIPSANLKAYDFYLRGMEEIFKIVGVYSYSNLSKNHQVIRRAEFFFKKALENDSTFALGYCGLAIVKSSILRETYSKTTLDSILLLCNLALSFDNQLAEAYLFRSGYYFFTGNDNKGKEDLNRAIKLNPSDWKPYNIKSWYENDLFSKIEDIHIALSLNTGLGRNDVINRMADLYFQAGFPEKSKEYNLEVFNLDGDSIRYLSHLYSYEYECKNYKNAIDFLKKICRIDSNYLGKDFYFALGYAFDGQFEESLKYVKKLLTKLDWRQAPLIGYVYWNNGYKEKAEYYFNISIDSCINDIKTAGKVWNGSLYQLAEVYAFKGEKDKAYENLKFFYQNIVPDFHFVNQNKKDPFFNNIRNEPEFQKILKDMEAKYQAEHERVRKWLEEQGKL